MWTAIRVRDLNIVILRLSLELRDHALIDSPGTLLLQLVCLPGGLGKDPPLGNKDHVLSRELLLKLPHQPEITE